MNLDTPIVVAGAGSIGCFVGGMLAAAGRRVALLARPRVILEIESHGLRLRSFEGLDRNIPSNALTLAEDPAIFGNAGVVLVTVKSADTADVADVIAKHAAQHAVIVSLQNGVGNVSILRERLPGRRVLGGMVPFNVIALGEGRIHRATSGDIVVERDASGVAGQLSVPGLKMRATSDIDGVLWGKLLVNLNNALNALAGLPLRRQLELRAWRILFADRMAEALAAIRGGHQAGVVDAGSGGMDAGAAAAAGRRVQQGARRRDEDRPQARSSMWEDLQRGRKTEIDYLQGVITAIAERRGLEAPLSRRIAALIKQAEAAGNGSPGLTPAQIRP